MLATTGETLLAGHKPGFARREIRSERSDILGPANAADRMLFVVDLAQLGLLALGARLPCIGNDPARRDRVDADVGTERIRERVLQGAPYVAWSAGSNVACPTIRTTNDMPIVEPPSLNALGLVPFQINPHYTDATLPNHGGETRAERLTEFLEMNPTVSVIGLREGTMLRVEDESIELLGDKPARVFLKGREVIEPAPGDSLQFLVEKH